MKELFISFGGGGANILRSLQRLIDHDVGLTDTPFTDLVKRSITFTYADTNRDSLRLCPEERLLIGSSGQGTAHDPEQGRLAFELSQDLIAQRMRQAEVIVIVATGGKGTGTGCLVPAAKMAREMKKLVIPIFALPSFRTHEVEKFQFNRALGALGELEQHSIRYLEILNDKVYEGEEAELSQDQAWENLNRSVAHGLRALLYVFLERNQVDTSDLCSIFSGPGQIRIGHVQYDTPEQFESEANPKTAAASCFSNRYYGFDGEIGQSLVFSSGPWKNKDRAQLRSELARLISEQKEKQENPYHPLFVTSSLVPPPWGVTALYTEWTGIHQPLEIDWSLDESDDFASVLANSQFLAAHDGPAAARATLPPNIPLRPDCDATETRTDLPERAARHQHKSPQSDLPQNGAPAPEGARLLTRTTPNFGVSERNLTHSVAPATGSAPRRSTTIGSLNDLVQGMYDKDPKALAMGAGKDTGAIAITPKEARSQFSRVMFRQLLKNNAFSESWKARILENLLKAADFTIEVPTGWLTSKPLSSLVLDDVRRVSIFPNTAEGQTVAYLLDLVEFFGTEVLTNLPRSGNGHEGSGFSLLARMGFRTREAH